MTPQPPHDETTPLGRDRELIAQAREATRTVAKAEALPENIGPYKILQLLGEGGMGVVYLAEQRKPIHRRVALKLIRVGMDTHQVIARFEAERETLAVLNHPNVARVLDAGATEHGRPYFVMEHVGGIPIGQYCNDHRLNTEARLRLFMQVCHAVQHAHQKGIIHRDIKPSNVLVTQVDDQPVVKVIDFGIAKATQQPLTEKTLFTHQGQFIGTPAYMSPEQADPAGIDIDTRTDVYSLGVLLYELLVGALPFDPDTLRNAAFSEMQRLIREVDPPRPSSRLTTLGDAMTTVTEHRRSTRTTLLREIRGDLDWIVMKCLEKDRARRYDTVSGLLAELQRHLNHEPVLAGPPSVAYRMRKFVRRNRISVAAVVSVFLALSAGLTLAATMYVRAEHARAETALERDRANQEARTSSEVRDLLVSLFDISDPGESRGNSITAREILDRGAQRVGTELADQPVVQSALMLTIGRVYQELGLFAPAREQFAAALQSREALLGRRSAGVAECLNSLGGIYSQQGELAAAETHLSEALALRRALLGDRNTQVAVTLNDLGYLFALRGDWPQAQKYYRESLGLERELRGEDSRAAAEVMSNLADALRNQGSGALAEAESLSRSAVEVYRKRLGNDHPRTLIRLNNLALVLRDRRNLPEAERTAREALETGRNVLGEEHPDVAIWMANYAGILQDQRRYAEAEPLFRESLAIYRKRVGEDHPNIVTFLNNLALVLFLQQNYSEAETVFRDVVVRLNALYGPEHHYTLTATNSLVRALSAQKKYSDAVPYLRAALRAREKSLPPDDASVEKSRCELGAVLLATGAFSESHSLLRQCLEFRGKTLPGDHVDLVRTKVQLGRCLTNLHRLDEAEAILLDAETILSAGGSVSSELRSEGWASLAELYEARDETEPGKGHAVKASEWRVKFATLEAETGRLRNAEPGTRGSSPVPEQRP